MKKFKINVINDTKSIRKYHIKSLLFKYIYISLMQRYFNIAEIILESSLIEIISYGTNSCILDDVYADEKFRSNIQGNKILQHHIQ